MNSTVTVYPNPTSNGSVYINYESIAAESVELLIYSMDGQLMLANDYTKNDGSSVQRIRIDLSSFPKGTYIMQFNKADDFETKKLIVL